MASRPLFRPPPNSRSTVPRASAADDAKLLAAASRRRTEDARALAAAASARRQKVLEELSRARGFFELACLDAYEVIDATQRMTMDVGERTTALAEIGVYHGRSFLALASTRAAGETCVAIDCFDAQEHNADESGRGDLDKFLKNLRRFWDVLGEGEGREGTTTTSGVGEATPRFVKVVRGNSLDLTPRDVVGEGADAVKVRMFSVDGSHTEEATLADLRLAEACSHERGVVILDDCFNPDWPGCVSGLAQYLANGGKFVPFCIGHNKVFLCAADYASTYARAFESSTRKTAKLFGCECVILKHGWIATFHANDA